MYVFLTSALYLKTVVRIDLCADQSPSAYPQLRPRLRFCETRPFVAGEFALKALKQAVFKVRSALDDLIYSIH
jgi:hypothetical protein